MLILCLIFWLNRVTDKKEWSRKQQICWKYSFKSYQTILKIVLQNRKFDDFRQSPPDDTYMGPPAVTMMNFVCVFLILILELNWRGWRQQVIVIVITFNVVITKHTGWILQGKGCNVTIKQPQRECVVKHIVHQFQTIQLILKHTRVGKYDFFLDKTLV